MKPKKVFVTWEYYGQLMNNLIERLKPISGDLSYVYGIPRGGIAIALQLSHMLDLEIICEHTITIGEKINFKEVLVVDDLTDSGNTLSSILSIDPEIKTATLFHKPHSSITPDFYVAETSDWIVFPWEDPKETPNREGYEGV